MKTLLLLLLVPVGAAAQITTGTSSAGLSYEASGSGEAVVLKLVTIPRAGHLVNLDAREAFNQAVQSFMPNR